MTWDVDFYTALMDDSDFSDAVSVLAFEYKAEADLPFAVYQLIAGTDTADLQGTTDEGISLVQLSVVASSPTEAKQIANYAITGAKAGLDVSSVFRRSGGRDPLDESFTYIVDFEIWFDNP